MYKTDTICAIASAMTNAGIGIIRVSGSDAIEKVDQIYKGKQKLTEVESHTVQYGHIVYDDKVIDEVMVLVLKAPRTYTTEDTVEIDCHGGTLVMQEILKAVIAQGVRPAEPGEFTKRAFLNGRIDLSQAESVMDVISSNSNLALHNSINQLQGIFSDQIKDMRSKIIYEIAYIESALDDPEHIDITGYGEELLPKIQEIIDQISHLLATADNGSMLKEGIKTTIIGKPNAGKSSLLNLLARKDRAIVTDIAGTTRDTLEEQISLNGISLRIIDRGPGGCGRPRNAGGAGCVRRRILPQPEVRRRGRGDRPHHCRTPPRYAQRGPHRNALQRKIYRGPCIGRKAGQKVHRPRRGDRQGRRPQYSRHLCRRGRGRLPCEGIRPDRPLCQRGTTAALLRRRHHQAGRESAGAASEWRRALPRPAPGCADGGRRTSALVQHRGAEKDGGGAPPPVSRGGRRRYPEQRHGGRRCDRRNGGTG